MQKSALYGIIAAAVVAAGIGIAFAAMSMNNASLPAVAGSQSSDNNNDVRVIKHAMGETEITGTPERIVVLEWTYAEDLLALGIQPIGVADINGMNKWVQMKELALSPDVVDVGTRQQPNLEKISQLDPDLIIGVQFRHQTIYEDLGAIAPTVLFNPYPAEEENLDHLTEMKQTLMSIAGIVGRHDAGVAAIERMNNSFEQAAQELSAAEGNEEFLVVQAYTNANNDAAEMRIFAENSIPARIMNQLGFKNAWDVQYELYGFSTVGLESLQDVDHANFFYVVQDDDNVFENEWNNPVWQNLQFVKEGRTYALGGDTWLFGGPISAEIFADKVAEALSSSNPETKIVSHAMGETEITGTPERIVAIGPEFVEHLVNLGVEPAGIVESSTFELWYPTMADQLSSDIIDLGDYPPNIEAIAQFEPDLIIAGPGLYGEFYEDLSSIAPTVMFELFPPENGPTQLERMEEVHMEIADIVGRQEQGKANLEKMHAKFDEAANKLQAAGLSGHKFIYIEAGVWEDAPWMNVYAENAMLSLILEEMGLENAVNENDTEFDSYGFISSSLEGLAALDGLDVHMFYTTALGDDVFENSKYWSENPVWTNLEFVKRGQVHNLDKVYAFAGPSQAELLVDKAVAALIADNSGTKTISHAMGETEITGIPKRIVALEWIYVEDLLALGVQPVGVTDIEGMNRWVNLKEAQLADNVVDVGARASPNLESIAMLEPDLIIGVDYFHVSMYDKLSEIAPTIILSPYPKQDENMGQLERMEQEFMVIADIVGHHDQGIAVLDRMNQTFEDASKAIKQTKNIGGHQFVVAAGFTWEDSPNIRVYTDNGVAVQILQRMGFDNAWDVEYAQYAYSTVSLEDLAKVEDANFFYIAQDDDNIFETTYKDNPAWKNLNFVQEGRLYPIGGDTWVAGGPISAELIAEKVVAAVTIG